MTNEELKNALLTKCPISWNGIDYSHVSAIIYRLDDKGKIKVSAELMDKNNHSVTIADAAKVTQKG